MDTVAISPLPSGGILQAAEPFEAHQYRQNVAPGEVLKASKLFRGLQSHEIAEISARLQPVSCKRGERILEQGIQDGRLYIIASGQVSVLLPDMPRGG
ncbi:MAG TPA: cyclic nucleotide-binding domain-containing protein, partial [Ktedonobacteraceae bacterium]